MRNIALSSLLILLSFGGSSCGQGVSKKSVEQIAANFTKDKYKGSLSGFSQATFAAGCFWHEETLFESIKGVKEVISGYSGGKTKNPTYEDLETGSTGHAETVNIYYDSTQITYQQLLNIYFESQEDPTQVDGQGPDRGTQYRSLIFYRNNGEKKIAEQTINKLQQSNLYSKPISAHVIPFEKFWQAEDYHQDYINTHTDNPYVANVSIRDIAGFQRKHPELIKAGHNFAAGK